MTFNKFLKIAVGLLVLGGLLLVGVGVAKGDSQLASAGAGVAGLFGMLLGLLFVKRVF